MPVPLAVLELYKADESKLLTKGRERGALAIYHGRY